MALLSTFAVEKWHQEGSSIPCKVICDEPEPERPAVEKPPHKGFMELMPERGLDKLLYKNLTGELGSGNYELDQVTKM